MRSGISSGWLVRLLTWPLLGASTGIAQSASAFNDAVLHIRRGDFHTGCQLAERLYHSVPESYAVYNLLGLCAAQRGQQTRAEELFRKSIKLNLKFPDARNNLAVDLLRRGNVAEARAEFNQVLKLDPSNVTALFNLGKVELANGDLINATSHLRKAKTFAPQDPQISLTFAEALLASGQPGPARILVRRFIENEKNSMIVLAASWLALQGLDEGLARKGFEKALILNSDARRELLSLARTAVVQQRYEPATTILSIIQPSKEQAAEWNALAGYANYKLGQKNIGIQLLTQAVQLDPKVEDFWIKLGEVMLFYGHHTDAAQVFRAGLEQLPDSPFLHFGLAVSHLETSANQEELRKHLEAALTLHPDFEPALLVRCYVSYRERNWTDLQDTAERLLAINKTSAEAHYYKALFLVERDGAADDEMSRTTARRFLEESIRLKPEFSGSHMALGRLLSRMGQTSLAIQEFKLAAGLKPNDPSPYYQLSMAYRKTGDSENSRRALDRFGSLRPSK